MGRKPKYEYVKGLIEYIKKDESLKSEIRSVFNLQSVIKDSLSNKKYAFVGFGCCIAYLKIDKRSKKSIKYNDEIIYAKQAFVNYVKTFFTVKEKNYFKRIGTPVEAVVWQDISINNIFYGYAVEYAKTVLGIKNINYVSYLD